MHMAHANTNIHRRIHAYKKNQNINKKEIEVTSTGLGISRRSPT